MENKQEEIASHHHYYEQHPRTPRGYIMDAKCESCKQEKKNIFPATTFEGLIRRWFHGKLKEKDEKGNVVEQCDLGSDAHYFCNEGEFYYQGTGRKTTFGKDVLAIRLADGRIIGNASKLPRCGSYRKGMASPAQIVMQQLEMPMIPFNVFDEAKLDLRSSEVVVQGKTEELYLPKMEWSNYQGMLVPVDPWNGKVSKQKPRGKNIRKLAKHLKWDWNESAKKHEEKEDGWQYDELDKKSMEFRHFIGAMVIKVQNAETKEFKYFLFDVDRREIEFYRFNAFLSELPKPAKTIEEAYELLKPNAVKQAEKEGKKTYRQGEWFFIEAELPPKTKADEESKKIRAHTPNLKEFDLDYNEWNDCIRPYLHLKKESIESRMDALNEKFRADHSKRVEEYEKYAALFEKACKVCNQEDPDKYATRGELRANNNRPNYVEKFIELHQGVFVKGLIEHSGREHEPLLLKEWCLCVPNTAVNSYTIHGNID
jgi:hypothetical protein